MNVKKKKSLSPYLLVLLSFAFIILLGSFLLTLPYAQKSGQWGNYVDSLFVSTSCTCVTGLSTYPDGIGNTLTLFGQIVCCVMIQIGGLGFITVLTFIISLIKKRIQFKDRFFIAQAINAITFADIFRFVRKIILITGICELTGFLLFLPAFFTIQDMSVGQKIWQSLFSSISFFNNAGFDILGGTSLVRETNVFLSSMPDWAYYYICSISMILIIVGGISFITIIDVFSFKRPKQWKAFTKIILCTTAVLLVTGVALFMLSDGIKQENTMTFFEALFQSVTCRTAGVAIYDQSNLSMMGKVVSCILMYIGGSPLSTAGGIKTITIFVIVLALSCYFRGKKVTAFNRELKQDTIIKCLALVFISITIIIIGFVLLCVFEANNASPFASPDNYAFEIFSAFGTVGLSASLTPSLSIGSKLTLCVLMFLGRLGPMTLISIFQKNMNIKSDTHFEYIKEDFLIG